MIAATLSAVTTRLAAITGVNVFDSPVAGKIIGPTVVVYSDAGRAARLKPASPFDTVTISYTVAVATNTAATTYKLADMIRQKLAGWRPAPNASPLTEVGTGQILHTVEYGSYSLTLTYQTTLRRIP